MGSIRGGHWLVEYNTRWRDTSVGMEAWRQSQRHGCMETAAEAGAQATAAAAAATAGGGEQEQFEQRLWMEARRQSYSDLSAKALVTRRHIAGVRDGSI